MHGIRRVLIVEDDPAARRGLTELVRAGKIRYIGCSNLPAWQVMKAVATSPNDPEILDFTGGIYLHQGHWREALANFLPAQELG